MLIFANVHNFAKSGHTKSSLVYEELCCLKFFILYIGHRVAQPGFLFILDLVLLKVILTWYIETRLR